jgi:predicted Zn-dependent peptidase
MIGYHIPRGRHPDIAALTIAVTILAEGRSSRLYRALVRGKEIALDYDFDLDELVDPGLAVAYLQARDDVPIARVEQAFHDEVDRLRDEEASRDELERARRVLLADTLRNRQTAAGRGDLLAWYEAIHGDARRVDTYAEEIRSVRVADVKRVVATYLDPRNRTVVTLHPTDGDETEA